jgi:hypothetical protein
MTVPLRANKLNRQGIGIELNPDSFLDGVKHLQRAETKQSVLTLFDIEKVAAAC